VAREEVSLMNVKVAFFGLLESSPELLLPIHFIRVLNIKNKPVKDQLKVIKEDVLCTLNKL
jgi:hypothetical protein